MKPQRPPDSVDHSAVIFTGGGWHALNPNPSELSAISCASVMFCVAADTPNPPQTFNGAAWSEPDNSATAPDYHSISCPSKNFCAALVEYGNHSTDILIGKN